MKEEEKKIIDGETPVVSEEDIAKVKEEIENEVIKEHSISPEQQELFNKLLDEATMPVELTDEKFKLGDNELDIRGLNKKNQAQMMFRIGALTIVYGKQILTSLVDISRLLMVVADKLGVEDIIAATDKVIDQITEKNEEIRKLKELGKKHDA